MKKYICKNHKQMKFSIPENREECISFNSFQEIKLCESHLENNSDCQLIEVGRIVNVT
jgi:hypothetical protein